MYKATDPSKIQLFAEKVKALDTSQLSNISNKNKLVKEYVGECKIEGSIMVKDIYIESYQKNNAYLSFNSLWKNVKDGNTLLEIYDRVDYKKLLKTVIARRGQAHIFDLSLSYVSDEHKYDELNLTKN